MTDKKDNGGKETIVIESYQFPASVIMDLLVVPPKTED